MKPVSRRKCPANMRAVNAESASISVLAASVMLELGLLRHNVRARCLPAHLQRNNEGSFIWKVLWRWIVKEAAKGSCHPHGQCSCSWTKKFYRKLRENTRRPWFFYRRNSPEYNPIKRLMERFEAKGCWLCSSIWLRFSGSGCRFRRQLAILLF